jgi:hypothetical protein
VSIRLIKTKAIRFHADEHKTLVISVLFFINRTITQYRTIICYARKNNNEQYHKSRAFYER